MTLDDKTLYGRNDDEMDDFGDSSYGESVESEYDEEEEEAMSRGASEDEEMMDDVDEAGGGMAAMPATPPPEIGRASCRERVYVLV